MAIVIVAFSGRRTDANLDSMNSLLTDQLRVEL
jgi:hypothetical protein